MVSRRTERAGLATAQWSVPIQHTNLNTASSEFDPSPTFDGLKLYFTSNRSVNFELFYATRAAPYQQFGPPTQIMELADPGTDAGPCVRIDDCEILREPALLDARARARAHE